MGRTRLSQEEKSRRAAERAKARKSRDDSQRRVMAVRKILKGRFTPEGFSDTTARLTCPSWTEVSYDQLLELSELFGSTNINISADNEANYDTFGGPYDTAKLSIVINNVNWTKIDNV